MKLTFRWQTNENMTVAIWDIRRMARFIQPHGATVLLLLMQDGAYRIVNSKVQECLLYTAGTEHMARLTECWEEWAAFERRIGSTEPDTVQAS